MEVQVLSRAQTKTLGFFPSVFLLALFLFLHYNLCMPETLERKYFFVALLLLSAGLGIVLLWPFLTVIALSAALSVVVYPIYHWLNRSITFGVRWLAALITVIVFLAILCVPLFAIGVAVFEQSQNMYLWLVENGNVGTLLSRASGMLGRFIPEGTFNLETRASEIIANLTSSIGTMFSATLSTIFSLFLVLLSMFYFLKDGAHWKKTIIRFSPLSNENDEKIIHKLKLAINGIIKGYLLIGAVQGVLMGVGFWIFGVPNAALWGVLAGIASLVPTIGTALVSIPAVIFLFAAGDTGNAIGMAVWAAVLVGSIDNLLNPVVVGKKIDIHPLLVLFAVLGGIALMGPVGILIGPLVISFMYALVSVYQSEMRK